MLQSPPENQQIAEVATQLKGNLSIYLRRQTLFALHAGSIYCDAGLRAEAGFLGEGVRSGSVLVVKTHTWEYPVEWSQMNASVRMARSLVGDTFSRSLFVE